MATAMTETTTVVTITIRPSVRLRENEPQMSPTACCSNNSRNQCSDAPRMGKVSPPSGPWNDRNCDHSSVAFAGSP